MAARKKRVLTPEEQLEAALVPESEWPYEVPDNWCWVRISSGFEVASSKRVHKQDWLTEGIPFYRTRELVKLSEDGHVDNELFISKEQYQQFVSAYGRPQIGDLLISGVGTIGVPYIVASDEPFYFKDGNIIWFKNRGLFLPEYVYFAYKSVFMQNQIHAMSAGTTVDTYTIINANRTLMPLPPLHEQRRIASRIEWLFAKLDDAEAELREVIDSSEQRQVAILHKAFCGELSKGWRLEHGVTVDSWNSTTIGQCCNVGSGGTPSRKNPSYYEGDIPWVKTGEISWGHVVETEEHISQEAIESSSAKLYEPGAILVAMYGMGQTRGKAAFLDISATTNQAVCVLEPHEELEKRFLFYFFKRNYWDIRAQSVGGNQLNLSATILKRYRINLPTVDEQNCIVNLLDSVLSHEAQLVQAAEEAIERIHEARQTILAKALRSELGTNDPDEPSSKELLASVFAREA